LYPEGSPPPKWRHGCFNFWTSLVTLFLYISFFIISSQNLLPLSLYHYVIYGLPLVRIVKTLSCSDENDNNVNFVVKLYNCNFFSFFDVFLSWVNWAKTLFLSFFRFFCRFVSSETLDCHHQHHVQSNAYSSFR